MTLNALFFVPFACDAPQAIDRIGLEISTLGASSVVRLGVYSDVGGVPSALLLDAGTIDASTTGWKEINISLTFSGLVWPCAVAQVAGCTAQGFSGILPTVGYNFGAAAGLPADHYSQTGITGALPTTATVDFNQSSNIGPRIRLRAA